MRRWLATTILALLLPGLSAPAQAGQIRLSTRSFSSSAAAPAPTLSSPQLTTTVNGDLWTFRFTEADTFRAEVTVRIDKPTDQYKSQNLVFDLFYLQDTSVPVDYVAAQSNDGFQAQDEARLLKSIGRSPPTDLGQLTLLNQRLRAVFTPRYDTIRRGDDPEERDVSIAYWLLQTTRSLVERHHLQLDSTVQDAMGWMQDLLDDPTKSDLFSTPAHPKTVTKEEARGLLAALNKRDAIVYAFLIDQSDAYLTKVAPAKTQAICPRLTSLNAHFENLPPDAEKTFSTPGMPNGLKATALALRCLAIDLSYRRAKATVTPAEVTAARELADYGDRLVVATQGRREWSDARALVTAKALDLRKILEGL